MLLAGGLCLFTGLAYCCFTQDTPEGNFSQLRAAGKLADGRKVNALKGALLKALNDDEAAPTGGRPRLERARASVGR